ncbi:hypothetical protein [Smaragdicoccus niigatensis]|uniref:hypothetical protein n=1 Tax=Smaragdicoccus niigatensis TaxID=359359 RepID=UPI00036A064F|nr:hypothetical protein [Smaragdicoccus niigatensis]
MPELFRRKDILARGFTDSEIRTNRNADQWSRLAAGVYAESSKLADLSDVERHRLAVIARTARLSEQAVVSHQSAAVMLGATLWNTDLRTIHVTRNRQSGGRIKSGLIVHNAAIDQGVSVDGVLVTTPARTIVDLARTLPLGSALVCGDNLARTYGVSRSDLIAEVDAAKGCKGAAAARRAITLIEPRAESAGESLSREQFHLLDDLPDSQGDVFDEHGRFVGRCDFYDDAWIGEFDGKTKYTKYAKPGQSVADVVIAEKRREDAFRDLGFRVSRWVWDDIGDSRAMALVMESRRRSRLATPPRGYIRPARLPAPATNMHAIHLDAAQPARREGCI